MHVRMQHYKRKGGGSRVKVFQFFFLKERGLRHYEGMKKIFFHQISGKNSESKWNYQEKFFKNKSGIRSRL